MSENETQEKQSFNIDELDDQALSDVAGGTDLNISCGTKTTNSGCNVVAGCGGGTRESQDSTVS